MVIDTLTQDQTARLEEYFKAKNDIIYFAENLIQVSAPGGDTTIKLYDLQKEYLHYILNEKHTIICKSRQVGASTMNQIYLAWICTFYENAVIGVVSRSGSESTDFARKTMEMIDKLPDWIRPEFSKRTEQTFVLKNGCKFYAAAINPANPSNVLRGKSLTILIVDEASFIPAIATGVAGIMPALSKAQKTARDKGIPYATTIISTPNRTTGIGKWYFDTWKTAKKGEGIYKPFEMCWRDIPEFANDPEWYKTQCGLLNNVKWRIAQELDMEFVASEDSFFDAETIKLLNEIGTEPISVTKINGYDLKQYAIADQNKFYLIGVDTASAAGSDSSTIWVMDYETGQQVAEFHSKLRVDDFSVIVDRVSKIYPNNLIIPECNSYGNQVCEYLTKHGNHNIYQTKIAGATKNSQKYRYGLYTNPQNRPLIIDALYTMTTESVDCIKSDSTALELISLIDYGNGKVAADEGEHDDLVMAYAFCCYVKLYDPPRSLISKVSSKEEIEVIDEVMSWNDEEDGIVSMAPALQKMNMMADNEKDPIRKNQIINNSVKKFIDTNLEKLLEQRSSQDPNFNFGGGMINLMDIMNGTTDTSWIR